MSETTPKFKYPLQATGNGLSGFLKIKIGKIYLSFVGEDGFLKGNYPNTILQRWALSALVIELQQSNRLEDLSKIHKNLWQSQEMAGFYQNTDSRMQNMLERLKPDLIEAVQEILNQEKIKVIVEIGCGNGKFLSFLGDQFSQVGELKGIDLNQTQIEQNKTFFISNPRMNFIAGDALEVLGSKNLSGHVIVTFGGVLEYFQPKKLNQLLDLVANSDSVAVLFVEPANSDFDFNKAKKSQTYGAEYSYAHPYPSMLESRGFELIYSKISQGSGLKWGIFGALRQIIAPSSNSPSQ